MNPDLSKLIELQSVDREIGKLSAEVAALPKRVAAIEEKLASSKQKMEGAQAALKADDTAKRKYEGDIQNLRQKISKYRDQMLAVKTNQEYRALTQEVEFAEKEIREAEDKILEIMMGSDDKDKVVKQVAADLKVHTTAVEKEKTEARERTAIDEKLLAELRSKRDQLRSETNPDVLRQYDRVFKFRGSAIAEAKDHKCAACQVMLRPQVYNTLRTTDELMTCDSCNRILYYDTTRDAETVDFNPPQSVGL